MQTNNINDKEQEQLYPSLVDRIQSTFLDVLLIVLLMFAATYILDKFSETPTWVRVLLFFGLFAIYEPVCTSLGFTLGNYIKKIRVRKADNNAKKINLLQAFLRYIFKVLLGWVSFITIHFTKNKRAIHDLVSGSVMIKL